jgi:hypothetical protein
LPAITLVNAGTLLAPEEHAVHGNNEQWTKALQGVPLRDIPAELMSNQYFSIMNSSSAQYFSYSQPKNQQPFI